MEGPWFGGIIMLLRWLDSASGYGGRCERIWKNEVIKRWLKANKARKPARQQLSRRARAASAIGCESWWCAWASALSILTRWLKTMTLSIPMSVRRPRPKKSNRSESLVPKSRGGLYGQSVILWHHEAKGCHRWKLPGKKGGKQESDVRCFRFLQDPVGRT